MAIVTTRTACRPSTAYWLQNTWRYALLDSIPAQIKPRDRPSRAVATGGISVYIPPPPKKNQSTLIFLCCCFVCLQWLVNIYTHPNQIRAYASETQLLAQSVGLSMTTTSGQRPRTRDDSTFWYIPEEPDKSMNRDGASYQLHIHDKLFAVSSANGRHSPKKAALTWWMKVIFLPLAMC